VKETISQLRLTTFESLKTAIRDCFNDFQTSTWEMSKGHGEKIEMFAENGREHTDDF
jgi:hypothetical protein